MHITTLVSANLQKSSIVVGGKDEHISSWKKRKGDNICLPKLVNVDGFSHEHICVTWD